MRKIRTAMIFLIIILLIGGCFAQFFYIRSVTNKILPLTDQLCSNVLLQRWDTADNALHQIHLLWQKHRPLLYSIVKHDCINDISAELAAFTADLASENYAQLPAEAARLREQIKDLARTEQLRFSNIL